METTISKLNKQIEVRLKGISDYEPIHINQKLGSLLDKYDIPEQAKLACLTIDTSMRHLDGITDNNLSKHSILIVDLLSAHFYTLLAYLNEPAFQLSMSKAIITVNEIKSSLHQQTLSEEEVTDAIIKIEAIFPQITISYFSEEIDIANIYKYLFEDIETYYPSYLKMYSKEKAKIDIQKINQSFIEKK